MVTKVTTIADSVSTGGLSVRLTTLELRFPRFLLPEFNTHRVFSRNAASSRAIPIKKLIHEAENYPAIPIRFGKNGAGMQDHGPLSHLEQDKARTIWLRARDNAVKSAKEYLNMENPPHKQIVNRLLEPFVHTNVLVTSTKWKNFLALRNHPDAQPEMQELAFWIEQRLADTQALRVVDYLDWHLPYITPVERNSGLLTNDLIKVSVARCARVSYRTHDDLLPTLEKDLYLYDMLVGSEPLHASPAEHQATPDVENRQPSLHGNFHGWIQYRKTLDKEFIND